MIYNKIMNHTTAKITTMCYNQRFIWPKLNTLETKMANISHQNKTTLFWRKKPKINLHQNIPIYGILRHSKGIYIKSFGLYSETA
jgi:hypothetical protein